jgi:prepilin peptidase CpaA
MQAAVIGLAAGALALSAYWDLRDRRIPDQLTLGVALAALARMSMARSHAALIADAAAGAAVFAVAFLFFCRGALGGGDVKLATATTLLVGHQDALRFLLVMSLWGAALALWTTLRRRIQAARQGRAPAPSLSSAIRPGAPVAISLHDSVPYGVAIAAAGITVLLLQHPIWE